MTWQSFSIKHFFTQADVARAAVDTFVGSGPRWDAAAVQHRSVNADEIDPQRESLLYTDPIIGLSSNEAMHRLDTFGKNAISEQKVNQLVQFLKYFTGSIAFLIEIAAVLSAVVRDWIDFGIIVGLLIINAFIGFLEEYRAGSALDALRQTLALKAVVRRDGSMLTIGADGLVPGDIVVLRLGNLVPADCRLLGLGLHNENTSDGLQIDQSALTGESLAVNRHRGDLVYSSSIVKRGETLAIVARTGSETFIGRMASLMAITTDPGHFQQIVNMIGNFLVIITIVMVIAIFLVLLFSRGTDQVLSILRDVLVLAVAAIPVALPTIMSVTMAVGATELARKQVIVKRLNAVEELASVSVLCSDKTGTLTLNQLTTDKPYLAHGIAEQDLLTLAYLASEQAESDAIETAIRTTAQAKLTTLQGTAGHAGIPGYTVVSFTPFDPSTKRTEALVRVDETNAVFKVAKGASHVILALAGGHEAGSRAVHEFAKRGLRALGVARTFSGSETWQFAGLISLLDPPRPDSAATIRECNNMGIRVKMITGDHVSIGKEVARRLGMHRCILPASKLVEPGAPEAEICRRCDRADGFAQMNPEHKHCVVEALQKLGYLVAMTGDGVNDAPALKKANVGIAVAGCTEAARTAADIVLLAPGLGTIVNGIEISRAIFQRMRSYALYRIASTIHFLIFFFVMILLADFYLRAVLLILIAIMNDLATMVICWDNVKISPRPDKWRLGLLLTLSGILGLALAALSFAVFFVSLYGAGVSDGRLETIMYLNISSAPHFVIFSTRLEGYFWERRPAWVFIAAVFAVQCIAVLFCVFGVLMPAIPVGWALIVLAISLVYFALLDAIKVQVMRRWSFALTARLWPTPQRIRSLRQRRQRQEELARVHASVVKVRRVMHMVAFVNALRWRRQGCREAQ